MSNNEFYDASEVRQAITPQIEQIIKDIFPQSKKKGADYRVGSIDGEAGESMSISCSGEGFGKWQDFSTGEKGDIIDLIKLTEGVDYKNALAHLAKKYTSLRPAAANLKDSRKKVYKTVDPNEYLAPLSQGVIKYAKEERHISEITLRKYKVVSTRQNPENEVAFVSANEANIPTRIHMVEVGTKKFRSNPDPMSPLWGTNAATPDACNGVLIITEGQWDALSYAEAGMLAASIPSGVSNMKWIEEEYEYLQQFHTFLLSFDMDEAGEKALAEAVKRLGVHKCKIIKLPLKDANEVIKEAGIEELIKCAKQAQPCDVSEMVTVDNVREETWDILSKDRSLTGDPFFIDGFKYRIREHECTIFFGHTGHGKALRLSELIPTPEGMKKIKDIHEGDVVYDEKGQECNVVAESPIFTDHDCYEITFDDNTKVVADAGHKWEVESIAYRASISRQKTAKREKQNYDQRHKANKLQIKTTEELSNTIRSGKENRTEWSIPNSKPYEGKGWDSCISPYLLGYWLGDGTSANQYITIGELDETEAIKNLNEAGAEMKPLKPKMLWSGGSKLGKALRKEGFINNKHIPESLLFADKESRLQLLQGLMDSDGTIQENRCEFCSCNEELGKMTLRLAQSLGIKATMITGEARLYGRFISKKYRVFFTTSMPVFKLSRHLKSMKPVRPSVERRFISKIEKINTEPTKCISVDSSSHLFLCTEACIPTHNSNIVQNQIAYDAINGRSTMIGSFEQKISFTLAAIASAYANTGKFISREHYDEVMDALNEQVMFFDSKHGKPKAKDLVEAFIYAYKRYGVKRFVIDNIMTMDVDRQDNQNQAKNADRLRLFVEEYPVNLAVVAHPRKNPEQGYPKPPHESDIMGASEWGNMAQNICTVWRNKQKEDNISEMIDNSVDEYDILTVKRSVEDSRVMMRKQRYTGFTDSKKQWFKPDTKRLVSNYDDNGDFSLETN